MQRGIGCVACACGQLQPRNKCHFDEFGFVVTGRAIPDAGVNNNAADRGKTRKETMMQALPGAIFRLN